MERILRVVPIPSIGKCAKHNERFVTVTYPVQFTGFVPMQFCGECLEDQLELCRAQGDIKIIDNRWMLLN